jgi:hypothetical protein
MPRLKNPPHDATTVAATLQSLGFDVDVQTDSDKQNMEDAFARLARKSRDADLTLVFFAGHGLQDQGKNYLAPVDASLVDETDLRRRFVRLDDVLDDINAGRGARVLLIDACRDNGAVDALRAALPSNRSGSLTRGLAVVPRTEGQLIAFATQPDRVAADGEGPDSPFTTALIAHLADRDAEIRTVLTRVRIDVAKATQNQQIPEVSDSLLSEVYLAPTSASAAPAGAVLDATPIAPAPGPPQPVFHGTLRDCDGEDFGGHLPKGFVCRGAGTGVGSCLKPGDPRVISYDVQGGPGLPQSGYCHLDWIAVSDSQLKQLRRYINCQGSNFECQAAAFK